MHLSIRKKIFLFTVIPVALIYNLLFVVIQVQDLKNERRYRARELETTTTLIVQQLDRRFNNAHQLGDQVNLKLQALAATQRDPTELAKQALDSFDYLPQGTAVIFQLDDGQFRLVFDSRSDILWHNVTAGVLPTLSPWLRAGIERGDTHGIFFKHVAVQDKSVDLNGVLHATYTTVGDKPGVVITFVSMTDFLKSRNTLMSMHTYLFLLDGSKLPVFPFDTAGNSLSVEQIMKHFNNAVSCQQAKDKQCTDNICSCNESLFTSPAFTRYQLPVAEDQLVLSGVFDNEEQYNMIAQVLPQTITFLAVQILAALIIWLCTGHITRALQNIGQAMDRVASGELDATVAISGDEDMDQLGQRFSNMALQLMQREERQRQSLSSSFDQLLGALREGVFYFSHDLDGRVQYISPWMYEAYATPQSERTRHYTGLHTDSPKNSRAQEITGQVLNGDTEMGIYEVELESDSGDYFHFEIVKVPVYDAGGRIVGAEGIGRNITRWVSDLEHLRGLLQYAPDAMVIADKNGVILMVNVRTETMLDYQGHALVGKKLCDLMSGADRERLGLSDPGISLSCPSMICSGVEVEVYRSSGELVPVEITMNAIETPAGLNFSLFMRDISERRAAEHALHISEERYRRTIHTLQKEYIFYSQRVDGSFINVTPSVESILGYTQEFFMHNWRAVMHRRSDRDLADRVFKQLCLGRGHPGYMVEIVKADGTIAMLEVFESPAFSANGEVTAIEGLIHDRTREWRAATTLAEARDAAQAASEAKTQFLSNMSHELRTPLNGVLGYAQLLLAQENIVGVQREQLLSIQASGQHLLNLINDILDLSRAESGHLTIMARPINLPGLVQFVRQIVCQRAEAQGLILDMKVHPDVPVFILGDDTKIRQVLINLLGNAIKFTNSGYVRLEVTCNQEQLIFTVQDSGIGIAREQIASIFSPFRQGLGGLQRGGTGLGLAISQRIASAMSGSITVTSQIGIGSCFVFAIPLTPAIDHEPPDTATGTKDMEFTLKPDWQRRSSGGDQNPILSLLPPEQATRLGEQLSESIDIGDIDSVRSMVKQWQEEALADPEGMGQWFDTLLRYCDDLDLDGLSRMASKLQETTCPPTAGTR